MILPRAAEMLSEIQRFERILHANTPRSAVNDTAAAYVWFFIVLLSNNGREIGVASPRDRDSHP